MVTNLADIVRGSAARRPAHIAVVDGDNTITYAGLDDQITAMASGLLSHGVKPGDRVALLLGNRITFVVALYGVMRAGAVAVPLNTSSTPTRSEYAVSLTGAKAVICDGSTNDSVRSADLGPCVGIMAGATQWDALLSRPDPPCCRARPTRKPSRSCCSRPAAPASRRPRCSPTGRCWPTWTLCWRLTRRRPSPTPTARSPCCPVPRLLTQRRPVAHPRRRRLVVCPTASPRTGPSNSNGTMTVVAGAPPMYVAWSADPQLPQGGGIGAAVDQRRRPSRRRCSIRWHGHRTTGVGGYGLTGMFPVVSTSLVPGSPKPDRSGWRCPTSRSASVPARTPRRRRRDDGPARSGCAVRPVFSGYWPDGAGGPDESGWFPTGDAGLLRSRGLPASGGPSLRPDPGQRVQRLPARGRRRDHPARGVGEVAVTGVDHPTPGKRSRPPSCWSPARW